MIGRVVRNRTVQVTSALLVGAACIWLSLRVVAFDTLLAEFSSFSLPLIALATVNVVLVSVVKALRWQWLYADAQPRLPWSTHFGILMLAQMLNLLIPLRLGEIARLGLMRQEGRPVGLTFGTIVVEKTLDLLAIGFVVLAGAPLALIPSSLKQEAGAAGLILGIVLFIALLVFGRLERPIVNALAAIPEPGHTGWARIFNWVRHAIASTLSSMATLRGRQLVRVAALTAAIWLLSIFTMQIMLVAFGLDVGWGAALALMLAGMASHWAPTPPAMIGVVGAVAMAVLASFGVDPVRGLALGTVLNVVLVGPPMVLGSIELALRLGRLGGTLSRASLQRAAGLSSDADRSGANRAAVVRPVEEGGHEQA